MFNHKGIRKMKKAQNKTNAHFLMSTMTMFLLFRNKKG